MTCLEDPQTASPTHSKMITSLEARPLAAGVAIIHSVAPASHVRFATVQVLAATALAKVEGILHEQTSAVSSTMTTLSHATGTRNSPPVASISTLVPEQNPGMTSLFEHLKPHKMPASSKLLGGFPITPSMQTVVVDCVPIVNPQLTSIVRENGKTVIS